MSLITRNFCPACKKTKFKIIFSLPYNSKKMTSFLDRYYKGQIDINLLKEYEFRLLECSYCNLIFQEKIPNEKFSYELYEKYIDKEDSLKKKIIMSRNIIKNFFTKLV